MTKQIDTVRITDKQLAELFLNLVEVTGYTPLAIKSYRSVIFMFFLYPLFGRQIFGYIIG